MPSQYSAHPAAARRRPSSRILRHRDSAPTSGAPEWPGNIVSWLPAPTSLQLNAEGALDESIAALPAAPAVFLLWPSHGEPYLGRTTLLNRRIARLLRMEAGASRQLSLRGLAHKLDYWLTGSRLEASLALYELARQHYTERYLAFLKLRPPVFLRMLLGNPYPRCTVTTRLNGEGYTYGPFDSRAAAELFQDGVLDLFQLRRCAEDLAPSPEHPGCIYGEIGKCLRPCQQVVSAPKYRQEARRLVEFLATQGQSLLTGVATERDRLSAEMEFEAAARLHRRYERITEVLQAKDELAGDVTQFSGVAVTPAAEAGAAVLWWMDQGFWQAPLRVARDITERSLAPLLQSAAAQHGTDLERGEHLALLLRWHQSSSHDGQWIRREAEARWPWRKIVNAVHRVCELQAQSPH